MPAPMLGVEPRIFWLEVKRVNHYATRALLDFTAPELVMLFSLHYDRYPLNNNTEMGYNKIKVSYMEYYSVNAEKNREYIYSMVCDSFW